MTREEPTSLADLAARLTATTVLCIGDIMLDRFVEGAVTRISPEAPIPVLRAVRETAHLGGAGNVAVNLAALGSRCRLIAPVGDDAAAAEILDLCRATPGLSAELPTIPGRPSTVKVRYVAHGQQLLRVDQEETRPLSTDQGSQLVALTRAALEGCGVVVLSDYGKGALGTGVITAVIAAARAAGIPVIVDPKGQDFRKYRGAALLTPNRQELAGATGLTLEDETAITRACRQLISSCGVDGVLATRSEEGMTLVHRGQDGTEQIAHLPARTREVFDVAGAGDTVVAMLAAGLAARLPLATAARLANAAAGVAVTRAGIASVTPDEVLDALHAGSGGPESSGAVSTETALGQVRAWRRRGLRVGLANGCFDLLHPGHLSLIAQARAACDRLVIALNSDASVRRLKGPARPLQDQASRAMVLAALADVDLVVIFDADTPLELIRLLEPDLLVKGADYREDQVVGADLVKKRGGTILLCDLLPGHSTTATAARLAETSRQGAGRTG